MTALATIGALLPLGLGITGHGGFISQPLAIIVIGGLVSSTLLTLLVLPVLYYLVEGAAERRALYPPLAPSVVTRVLAGVGGALVVAGIALVAFALVGRTIDPADPGALITKLVHDQVWQFITGQLGLVAGVLLLLAALVSWLVRSRRNRRAHPVAATTAQPAPGSGSAELAPTVDA
jgi:hypothetical protein